MVVIVVVGIVWNVRRIAAQGGCSDRVGKHGAGQSGRPGSTARLHGHGVSELRQPLGTSTKSCHILSPLPSPCRTGQR